MSGHKHTTVSISEEEYRRLHETEIQLRFLNSELPGMVEKASIQTRASLQAYVHDLEQRQMDYLDTFDGVNQSLLDLEIQTSQAILDQQQQIQAQMDSLAGDLWQHTSEALSNVEQAYWSHIETISSLHRDELQWLADQYNQASSRDQQKMDFAHQWLEMVNRMFASITSIYDHQRYLPGAMKKIQARIAQADLAYQQSIPETTLTFSMAIFLDLSEIRVTLEKRQLQLHTLLQAASQYASRLEKKAQKYTQIPAMDLQGHPLPLFLDVDYWVKGAFHDLTRRIETLRAELSENPQHFSIAELQDILETQFPHIDQALEDLIFQARLEAISSQLRLNIADKVLCTLQNEGYQLSHAVFRDADARQDFCINLKNIDGSEIEVFVNPMPDALPSNELHLITHPKSSRTEHEVIQQAKEIERTLHAAGLSINPFVTLENSKIRLPQAVDLSQTGLELGSSTGLARKQQERSHTVHGTQTAPHS